MHIYTNTLIYWVFFWFFLYVWGFFLMNACMAHNTIILLSNGMVFTVKSQCGDVTEGQGDLVWGHLMSQIRLPLMHPGGAVSLHPSSECTFSFLTWIFWNIWMREKYCFSAMYAKNLTFVWFKFSKPWWKCTQPP